MGQGLHIKLTRDRDHHARQHRIEAIASVADGGRFNAEVRIRRVLSEEKPHVETVTCFKVTAALAEAAGELWAKRWIDFNDEDAR